MALGRCEFITCGSLLGTHWRGPVDLADGGRRLVEILLCPTHERLCTSIRDGSAGGKLMMTTEGWLYSSVWMDSLAFYRAKGL